jgi:hypothetical protein
MPRRVAGPVLGPWPVRPGYADEVNGAVHVVARSIGLGALGGAVIGLLILLVLVVLALAGA